MDDDFEDVFCNSTPANWDDDYLAELNTSEHKFPNTLWHVKPPAEIAIKTSAMLVIALPGLYLNSVILIVLLRNKWLWTPSNYLIGNLAIVDFVTLLICPWFMLVRDFFQNYVLKNFGCRFEGFLQSSILLANVGAVVLVSYDRLAAAALPSEARVTKKWAPRLIVISWIISFLFSLPWIIHREYVERQWLNHLETFCVEDPSVLVIYWHFISLLLVWIPLGLMVLTYGTIMWRLERSARELSSRGSGKLVARAKSRALRVTACVLITDVICRLPYSALIYLRDRRNFAINSVEGLYSILWFSANYLMYLNCTINPLIYGFTNSRLLKAMDRTPGIACCKFGSWCCVCVSTVKKEVQLQQNNTEKIFVIETTPRPNKKLSRIIKNMLHIHTDTIDLSIARPDETTKPTRVTPLKIDCVNKPEVVNNKEENCNEETIKI